MAYSNHGIYLENGAMTLCFADIRVCNVICLSMRGGRSAFSTHQKVMVKGEFAMLVVVALQCLLNYDAC